MNWLTNWKCIARWIWPGLVLLSVSSCARGIDEAQWTEEVRLHDGRTVEVWRRAAAHAHGFPNARRGGDIEFDLKFAPLDVAWKGGPLLVPLSFEILDSVPYLVLFLKSQRDCGPNKKPTDYAARILRWENDRWKEVLQEDFPMDVALFNLYQSYWGAGPDSDARGLIRWSEKVGRDHYRPDKPYTVQRILEREQHFCARRGNWD